LKQSISIFKVSIDNLELSELSSRIINDIKNGIGGYQVSINTLKILELRKSRELQDVIANSKYVSADGASISLAVRILQNERLERVAGIDLAERLIELCALHEISIFLYGSDSETLKKTQANLKKRFIGLKIAGAVDGYSKDVNSRDVLNEITLSDAKFCMLALPSPAKEFVAYEFSKSNPSAFFLPVGGAFEIFAKTKKRAPKLVQKVGLEWAFRVMQDPIRLAPRYARANAFFLIQLVKEMLSKKSKQD
jgi:N-acetylglucosaminyldiphosphoundecaprenol N-acetyl-beta-D-mannosaminyltransferase